MASIDRSSADTVVVIAPPSPVVCNAMPRGEVIAHTAPVAVERVQWHALWGSHCTRCAGQRDHNSVIEHENKRGAGGNRTPVRRVVTARATTVPEIPTYGRRPAGSS